ncbi:MAG TPA: hypothetical protein VF892_06275 [Pseudonocardiaceae bacterium]
MSSNRRSTRGGPAIDGVRAVTGSEGPDQFVARRPHHPISGGVDAGQRGGQQYRRADAGFALHPHAPATAVRQPGQRCPELGQFPFAADEEGWRGRHRGVARRGTWHSGRDRCFRPPCDARVDIRRRQGSVGQDPLVDALEHPARFDAQFGHEHPFGGGEDVEGVGAPPGPVQRRHQQCAWPFPKRVCVDQGGEVRNGARVIVHGQPQFASPFQCAQSAFVESGTVQFDEGPGQAGKRLAAPQRQGVVERVQRGWQVAAFQSASRGCQLPVELLLVEFVGRQPQ